LTVARKVYAYAKRTGSFTFDTFLLLRSRRLDTSNSNDTARIGLGVLSKKRKLETQTYSPAISSIRPSLGALAAVQTERDDGAITSISPYIKSPPRSRVHDLPSTTYTAYSSQLATLYSDCYDR